MKAKIFLGIFILGLILMILNITVFNINSIPESILLPVITAGGAIGACVYSKKAREFFKGLIRAILEYL